MPERLGPGLSLGERRSMRLRLLVLRLLLLARREQAPHDQEQGSHHQKEQRLLERSDGCALQGESGEGEHDGCGGDGAMHGFDCSPGTRTRRRPRAYRSEKRANDSSEPSASTTGKSVTQAENAPSTRAASTEEDRSAARLACYLQVGVASAAL